MGRSGYDQVVTTTELLDFSTFTDDDLAEYLDGMGEVYGETYAQYRSEIAMFGDAWPGSALEVAAMRRDLEAAEAEWTRRHPTPPPVDPLTAIWSALFVAHDSGDPF